MEDKKTYKKVGTHHGRFHADEVMATAVLKELYDIEVIRTRDPEVLKELELVYDVGGGEFDHHDTEKVYRESGTPYAACGLIWRSFGKDVIRRRDESLPEDQVDSVFNYIDDTLMEGIDAIDNGLKTADTTIPTANISTLISGFNPAWDSEMSEDIAFDEAVDFASSVLANALDQKLSVIRASGTVKEAYENRPRPEIMVLDTNCPWGQTLKELDEKREVLFVIYPNKDGYSLQTVRKGDGTMRARKDLPKAWAGKRDAQLGRIIGIEDAVFCHPGRFIAGAKSFESIMKMAEIAVNEPEEKRTGKIKKVVWRFKILLRRRQKV